MKQVDMHDAKFQLSELGTMAWKGEKIVITKAGKPYLDLAPHKPERLLEPKERMPGRLKGQIKIAPGFDTTPEDIINSFEAK
jgi:antitoxin (DNA-binding transcriptional repressor) of toxin-antitoxin stability system